MRSKLFMMFLIFVSLVSFKLQSFTAETNPPIQQEIDRWLILGPAPISPLESELLKSEDNLFKFNHIPVQKLLPVKDEKIMWNNGNVFTWQATTVTTAKLEFDMSNEKRVVYLAVYLEPDRWLQTDLVLTPHNGEIKTAVFLDGDSVNTNIEKENIHASLNLTHEKHLLIIKALVPAVKTGDNKTDAKKITIAAVLENKDPFKNETVKLSLEPIHALNPENVLNTITVDQIQVSPDGKLAALSLKQTEKGTGKGNNWIEILDIATGKTIFSSENFGKMSKLKWLKHSRGFTYTVGDDEKTSLFQYDLNSNTQQCIIKDIKNFSSYWWANDNSYLVYSVSHAREDKDGFRYIKEIRDRTKFPEDRNSMFLFFPAGSGSAGVTHQISDEVQNFNNAVISPDSTKVLLTKEEPDNQNRPYLKTIVYLFDVKNLSLKELLTTHTLTTFMWSPDSKRLLLLGGPSSFDGLGINLANGIIPNEYDTEAYIFDLNSSKKDVLSKKFDPNITKASWNSPDNIYFLAEDTSFMPVFKYSLGKGTFSKMKTMVDVVQRIDFAQNANIAVFLGSGATNPHKLYKLDLTANNSILLKDYNRQDFRHVTFAKWEDWNYKSPDGKTIVGLLYFPPDFDINNVTKKYPCITYFYGGTSPVERIFGGRYPMEWYAANGYIVYVLQPTGATGFGQEASAVHVNDWGKETSKEIIAAVKELVRTHPYIDPARVGAMGASYGGFLTQYLATQTPDTFAAFISHAGITSIASYWGEGDWGYNYSGFATADSFPWNRKDIYVDRSPFYLADKIQKPLLLLHGEEDNNVPPGESYQMFAALKILGKDVALVTFAGQQHFIGDYKKRLQWMRTIIAWWDKYLKDQPQHWDFMYNK